MEATIILAEAITVHPDGTFSMLRGGISRVLGPLPLPFKGAVLAHFAADLSESGPHNWRLCVVDEDGNDVMPRVSGAFTVPDGGGNGSFAMAFSCNFQEYGNYSFRLALDKHLHKAWNISVACAPESAPQED